MATRLIITGIIIITVLAWYGTFSTHIETAYQSTVPIDGQVNAKR